VDAIACGAGTNKMSFYRNFVSKGELVARSLREAEAEAWEWWGATVAGVSMVRLSTVRSFATGKSDLMKRALAMCCVGLLAAHFTSAYGEGRAMLRLVQTISLPGVNGRLDHMAIDLEKKRLFLAAVANGTLEVIDLAAGKVIISLPGIKDAQDAIFLGGHFNKLYVSSLDGTLRIFQGETFRLVQALKLEPDPNRLLYDPATDFIYFGYGGQNAGFDTYERVGIMLAKRGAQSDQFVADMIAPTYRPGHLADLAMDDDGRLLVCDSRADLIFLFDTRKRELVKSWPAHGDGAADMSLDRARHRLFVGTRIPPELTVYDSQSGKEIVSLPGPQTMDGVFYDPELKRIYVSGGRWYETPEASPGWVYVYQQRDVDHYELISKIMTRPGSGTSLFVPRVNRLYVASQMIGDQEAAILVFEPVP
jgi:AcrR family transcriptional regulator